jgi:hypothetical protein
MGHQRTIEVTLRRAHALMWNHLPPPALQPDDFTVKELRALLTSPEVRQALDRGADTASAFSLRAVARILADQCCDDEDIMMRLWAVLDDPLLTAALGISARVQIIPPSRRGGRPPQGPQVHRR